MTPGDSKFEIQGQTEGVAGVVAAPMWLLISWKKTYSKPASFRAQVPEPLGLTSQGLAEPGRARAGA